MNRHDTLRRNADAKATLQIGNKFGRLTIIEIGNRRAGGRRFNCLCECGNVAKVTLGNLQRGKTKSCGCLDLQRTAEMNRTHGLAGTPEYLIWKTMRQRCRNPKNQRFGDYGGRGISVCARWDTFQNFIADMGPRPSPDHSIDRVDNDGNYEPSNCRWATAIQQRENRRDTVSVATATESTQASTSVAA